VGAATTEESTLARCGNLRRSPDPGDADGTDRAASGRGQRPSLGDRLRG